MSLGAYMTAVPSGGTSGYSVNLYTTQGQATQWTVNWGDGNQNTYYASSYTHGVFPTPFTPPAHSYGSIGNYTITAQAYDGSEYATANFALSSSFGNYQFTSSGKSVALPDGYSNIQAGSNGGVPMAVDPVTGDIYVAAAVPMTGGGTTIAITRFLPDGELDTSWNGRSPTLVLPQTGSGSTDTPYGIGLDPKGEYLGIAGSTNGDWLAEMVATGQSSNNPPVAPSHLWSKSTNTLPGYATSVWIDDDWTGKNGENETNGTPVYDMMAAGTADEGMAVAFYGTYNNGSYYGDFDPDFAGGRGIEVIPSVGSSSVATSITEYYGNSNEAYVVGGTTSYACGGRTGSDFTLALLDESGTDSSTWGNNPVTFDGQTYNQLTFNFGQKTGSQCKPYSDDSCFSTVVYQESQTQPVYLIDAVGTTDVNGSYQFAYAQVVADDDQTGTLSQDGQLNTGFGTNGLAFGPYGAAHAAVLSGGNLNNTKWNDEYASGGYVYVAGDNGDGHFEVASIGPTGTDGNFSESEIDFAPTNSGSSVDDGTSIGWETDGTVVAGGYTNVNGSTDTQIALADYQANNYVSITPGGGAMMMSLATSSNPPSSTTTDSGAQSSGTSSDSAASLLDSISSDQKQQTPA